MTDITPKPATLTISDGDDMSITLPAGEFRFEARLTRSFDGLREEALSAAHSMRTMGTAIRMINVRIYEPRREQRRRRRRRRSARNARRGWGGR